MAHKSTCLIIISTDRHKAEISRIRMHRRIRTGKQQLKITNSDAIGNSDERRHIYRLKIVDTVNIVNHRRIPPR